MKNFLTASKSALLNLSVYKIVRIVIGNQSCDLDSVVCALAQGFCEYLDSKEEKGIAVIPILNVSEREFRIKTEVVYYLRKHDIPQHLLTFRDQIDLHYLNKEHKLEMVLVDHHVLPNEDRALADSVVRVIDHRPQDESWLWHGRTIQLEMVGSCATLVARNLIIKHPEALDARLANFLRGPILVDTCNFSREVDRATVTDVEIMETLERIASSASDRKELFDEILRAKQDVSELTAEDLTIKDLKVESGLPFVTLPMLVEDFLRLEGALEALQAFATSRKYSLAILMGIALSNDHVTRDIGVFSLVPNDLENKITDVLLGSSQLQLELTLVKRVEERRYRLSLYRQGNVRATRKHVLPIVKEAMSKQRNT